MSSVLLWKDVHEIADAVCKEFGLSYGKLLPETRKLIRHLGECYACDRCVANPLVSESNCNEKIIHIRIHQLKNKNKPLAKLTILSTLAHELAHMKHFTHGKIHRKFEKEIMAFMREKGYLP